MLYVIGTGPGRPEWIPPIVRETVLECDVLIGSARLLQLFPEFKQEKHTLTKDLGQTYQLISEFLSRRLSIGVLVSGDPGFYSILSGLRREFPGAEMTVLPGISSMQLAFAKMNLPWQDVSFCSVHGRDIQALPRWISSPLAVLTGGENTPQRVAQVLLDRGLNLKIGVGNALAYEDEVWDLTDASILARSEQVLSNAILIIFPPENSGEGRVRLGIADDEFIRGRVPMTKAEVRVQVLAKAGIASADNILDIGAGTGSISIEAAMLAPRGHVYAVEQNPEAQDLIRKNRERFQTRNLSLIPGSAPAVLNCVPPVQVCIIGGSKGQLREILTHVPLVSGGTLVMTAVTLENAASGLGLLKELGYQEVEAVSLQVVRWQEAAGLHMANSLNQVFIISATKGAEHE